MKDWFKARNIWGAAIMTLADDEAGRLMKAIWQYTMTGEKLSLPGPEKVIFAMILMTLGQDSEYEADVSAKRAAAGSTGGKQKVANVANASFARNDVANQANASFATDEVANVAIASNKNKNKNIEKEKEKEQDTKLNHFLSSSASVGMVLCELCCPRILPEQHHKTISFPVQAAPSSFHTLPQTAFSPSCCLVSPRY